MPIEPFSITGLAVLAIFITGMIGIVLESWLKMDKFKPALLMMISLVVIGLHYHFSSDDPNRYAHFLEMQHETETGLFSLIAFMAFTWMIVEVLYERGVFSSLNRFLMTKGLGPKGMFWATGALSALLSPFLNNITTAMIFGKALKSISGDERYTHAALCNIIIASNSGVWFIGTVTSLMVVLAGKITLVGLLLLAPAGLIGWAVSAAILHWLYLNGTEISVSDVTTAHAQMKKGGWGVAFCGVLAISGAVLLNVFLHVDIEFAIGIGLGLLGLYAWHLKRKGHDLLILDQLQNVEWSTLIFFIGIITGVAALNHAGWLSYITRLFEIASPTLVNIVIGILSGILDNVPVEASAIMANPSIGLDQWALQALMVGIGGSLTVIGSAAGIMVMSIDKTYTFGSHLKFMPVLLVNFFVSLAVWYLQFQVLGLY